MYCLPPTSADLSVCESLSGSGWHCKASECGTKRDGELTGWDKQSEQSRVEQIHARLRDLRELAGERVVLVGILETRAINLGLRLQRLSGDGGQLLIVLWV